MQSRVVPREPVRAYRRPAASAELGCFRASMPHRSSDVSVIAAWERYVGRDVPSRRCRQKHTVAPLFKATTTHLSHKMIRPTAAEQLEEPRKTCRWTLRRICALTVKQVIA